MTSLLTGVLGEGPAATVSHNIPDLHHFRGSFGGKDVIPLWRNAPATEPNITEGLLRLLSETYGVNVTPENIFSYSYAILASPAYTEQFSEELFIPGPHLPITRDNRLFSNAVEAGNRLLWLHTYGERFVPDEEQSGQIPQGTARCRQGIPTSPEGYPENFNYGESEQMLRVGDGEFTSVSPEIWNFSVSGLEVVKSWLNYRKKSGAGKRSSPLDLVRPERWTAQMTQELLELLWVIEHTIAIYPNLETILEEIVQSDCFTKDELPTPTKAQRLPPKHDNHPELFS